MLMYEYMSNNSLNEWLLNWNKQVSIIIGVAQGLAYLHHKCNLAIVQEISFWIRITPPNWLILGWPKF